MKQLFIHTCNDPLLWYSDKVGQYADFVGHGKHYEGVPDVYWSKEPAGYKNIVYTTDAIIVDRDI